MFNFFHSSTCMNRCTDCFRNFIASCEIGKFNELIGQSSCKMCTTGTYNDQKKQFTCKDDCSVGSYITSGKSACLVCEKNHYQDQNESFVFVHLYITHTTCVDINLHKLHVYYIYIICVCTSWLQVVFRSGIFIIIYLHACVEVEQSVTSCNKVFALTSITPIKTRSVILCVFPAI